jgi:hypothetical protein
VRADGEELSLRLYPDDPVCCAPKPLHTAAINERKTDVLFDFLYNSFAREIHTGTRAEAVNTLGEVLDSEWFTNRQGRSRMSAAELKQGPGEGEPPQPPYVVVGAKLDGITPGFRMRDSKGTLYFIKPDPRKNPEMATAADVMGSRFFYAIGYNTPENYIAHIRPEAITISPEATRIGDSGKLRPMTIRDIRAILWKVPRAADGSYRMVASRAVAGVPLGPFRYKGTRTDDPNDVIPHENRRDLRGLFVFCAWLNHTDAKSINSIDTLVNADGRQYVRHHLIDFGSSFGSDSDMPKNARFGNGYSIPSLGEVNRGIMNFGLIAEPWESANHPKIPAIGRFEANAFNPESWVPNYPNPAFDQRTPEDEYWAAKIVMSFTDEDIRAIVEAAQYTDPRATEYMTKTIIARRDKIGRTYFTKVLAVDEFRIANGTLEFKDLAVERGFVPPRQYTIGWFRFDNARGLLTVIPGEASRSIPQDSSIAPEGTYFAARLSLRDDAAKSATVFVRKTGATFQIVAIDRRVMPRDTVESANTSALAVPKK